MIYIPPVLSPVRPMERNRTESSVRPKNDGPRSVPKCHTLLGISLGWERVTLASLWPVVDPVLNVLLSAYDSSPRLWTRAGRWRWSIESQRLKIRVLLLLLSLPSISLWKATLYPENNLCPQTAIFLSFNHARSAITTPRTPLE